MTINIEQFNNLKKVNVTSFYGPCLKFLRFVRMNRKTATLAYRNGSSIDTRLVDKGMIHFEECSSCNQEYLD